MPLGYHVHSICILNITEFYFPIFGKFHERERKSWVKESIAQCDSGLFWRGDDKLVIIHSNIELEFINYVIEVLGYNNTHIVSPSRTTYSICEDILSDPSLFEVLVETLRSSGKIEIVAWGATEEFYRLTKELRSKNVEFTTPEIPVERYHWIGRYLDSKLGFREFAGNVSKQNPIVRIPNGITCTNLALAAQVAKWYLYKGTSIAVKADQGVGGHGILFYRKEQFTTPDELDRHIATSARLMPLLRTGPIIVEEFIPHQNNTHFGSPSVQAVVDELGNVNIVCIAGQILLSDRQYVGAIVSQSVDSDLLIQLREIAKVIGQVAARLGYTGIYGIDTVIGTDQMPYCVEMNIRRTSVTYLSELMTYIIGIDEIGKKSQVALADEFGASPSLESLSFANLLDTLDRHLFRIGGKKEGVVITLPSARRYYSSSPKIGFVVIGENIQRASELRTQIHNIFKKMQKNR